MKGDAPFVNSCDENEQTHYNLSKQTLTVPSHYLQTDSRLGVSRDTHTMEKTGLTQSLKCTSLLLAK